jgi:hypothetical protein
MTKLMTTIHDLETGEIVTREMTADEIANLENVQANCQAEIDAKTDFVNAQASAIAKLEAIGLTAEEIEALKK